MLTICGPNFWPFLGQCNFPARAQFPGRTLIPRKRAQEPQSLIFLHIQTFVNMSIPSITNFAQDVTNEDDAIYWLVSMGVIKPLKEEVCIVVGCSGRMSIKNKKASYQQLRCNKCHAARSRFANTFFDISKIKIHKIMYLGIMWLNKCSVGQALSFNKKTGNETICNYYCHFCQLVANMIRGSTRENVIFSNSLWTNSEYPNILKNMFIWSL